MKTTPKPMTTPSQGRQEEGLDWVSMNLSYGAAESAVVADILDLLAEAIWRDVTGESRDYGHVSWGTEP